MIAKRHGNSDPMLQELIRIVFDSFNKKGRNGVSKKQILKILYQVKKELPNDGPIVDKLSYYWYKFGPYSQVVYDNFNELENRHEVYKVTITNAEVYRLHESANTRQIEHTDEMMQARAIIIKKVDQFRDIDSLMADVYSVAPTPFYKSFGLDFKKMFEHLCNPVKNGMNAKHMTYSTEDIEKCFTQAVLDVPRDECFREFRYALNLFSQCIFAILSNKLPHDDIVLQILSHANMICDEIWTAFVYCARLKYHDSFYDDEIPKWQKEFDEKLHLLQSKVSVFHDDVFSKIRDKSFDGVNIDENHHGMSHLPDDALQRIREITG